MSDKDNKRTQVHNYAMDRIKKLTEAVYRVSNLYPDQEPLKWTLRENAIQLYNRIMSIMDMSDRMSDRKIETDLREIISSFSQMVYKLELASLGGFISDINFEILKKEYIKLKDFIQAQKNIIISESFMDNIMIGSSSPVLEFKKETIGHLVSNRTLNVQSGGVQTGSVQTDKIDNRKQKILNFLKNNGKKTIREISSIFEGISEKSVQRDLAELVRSGQLATEGEKRWRVYFLAQNIIDKII
ncbi:DeoR family transcriptional regulator [Patescibacteria group bacterium]|nr:DeoR family transcriptional regulator [Patescibacteria group bacterium]